MALAVASLRRVSNHTWPGPGLATLLGLVRLELPNWQIRRIACEGTEWFCSLSQRPHLPLALDGTADGTHDDLPLAILRALIEAVDRVASEVVVAKQMPVLLCASGTGKTS